MATRMAPAPYTQPYTKLLLRIPPDLLEAVKTRSMSQDRSVNGELVHLIRQGLAALETTSRSGLKAS